MRVVLLTNDPVCLNFAEAALRAEGIPCHILDATTSVLEGSIGAIQCRLVAPEAHVAAARRILKELGIEPYGS